MNTTRLLFDFERSTKNMHRFKEVDRDGKALTYEDQMIGTLYVKKDLFNGKVPKGVELEVTALT